MARKKMKQEIKKMNIETPTQKFIVNSAGISINIPLQDKTVLIQAYSRIPVSNLTDIEIATIISLGLEIVS